MTAEQFYDGFGEFLDRHGVKHFRAIEVCRVGRLANGRGPALKPPPRWMWPNALPTLRAADWLRERVGPLWINSGYRDPDYNLAVGGAPGSMHMRLNALDLSSASVSPDELARLVEQCPLARAMGVGVYSSFVHVDSRWLLGETAPARW